MSECTKNVVKNVCYQNGVCHMYNDLGIMCCVINRLFVFIKNMLPKDMVIQKFKTCTMCSCHNICINTISVSFTII